MFRRFFFIWFVFFAACGLGGGLVVLYHRWKAACLLEEAETKAFISTCLEQFSQRRAATISPHDWDWDSLTGSWVEEFGGPRGFTLMDSVGGVVTYSTGEMSAGWNPVVQEPADRDPHWVPLENGERCWTVVPSPEIDPQYRLWIAFGKPISFRAYLGERRLTLTLEALALLLAFVAFYRWAGSPTLFLAPLVETLQRALERADSPLHLDPSLVPGEFAPLAKTLSLILEARQKDYEEKVELAGKVEHFSDQKAKYSSWVSRLKSLRDDEQTAVERIQAALLEANREPILILDRTRRIHGMNEPARRVLALAGQTGTTLRHSELEAILDVEMEPGSKGGVHRIVTNDLIQGRPITWRVKVLVQSDWRDPSQIQTVVVYLNQESIDSARRGYRSPNLFALFGEALEQSWRSGGSGKYPIQAHEKRLLEVLLQTLATYEPTSEAADDLTAALGLLPAGEIGTDLGQWRVNGSTPVWQVFSEWLTFLLGTMQGSLLTPILRGVQDEALRIEWGSTAAFPIGDWLLAGEDPLTLLRRELIHQTLERLESNLIWHPSSPQSVVLAIGARRVNVGPQHSFLPHGLSLSNE